MKDEDKRKIFSEFVGLNSKMYSLIPVGSEGLKKEKGVNKNVFENIRHKECLDVLPNKAFIRHKMKRIQSKLCRIEMYDICEISLSYFDDKRYILNDGINSLAYFHKKIRTQF